GVTGASLRSRSLAVLRFPSGNCAIVRQVRRGPTRNDTDPRSKVAHLAARSIPDTWVTVHFAFGKTNSVKVHSKALSANFSGFVTFTVRSCSFPSSFCGAKPSAY